MTIQYKIAEKTSDMSSKTGSSREVIKKTYKLRTHWPNYPCKNDWWGGHSFYLKFWIKLTALE